MEVMEGWVMPFRRSKSRYLGRRMLFRSRPFQRKICVSGRASRYGCHNEGFSDCKRVFREKAAFQSKDVSDKEDIHKRSRGMERWVIQQRSGNETERDKQACTREQRSKFTTVKHPLIQRVTDKVRSRQSSHQLADTLSIPTEFTEGTVAVETLTIKYKKQT